MLDTESWSRREHYRFFRTYDNPFFNICADVDVSVLLERCRAPGGPSFFVASLHLSLKAANAVEPFRYRIRGEQVVVHDVVHGGSTILLPEETFSFAYFDYDPDFERFASSAAQTLEGVRRGSQSLEERADRDDLIHYSVIPWVAFTSFSHARKWRTDDSVPKIVFGKHRQIGDATRMPVSVEVHHALMDGLHVGRFFEEFQRGLNDTEAAWRV